MISRELGKLDPIYWFNEALNGDIHHPSHADTPHHLISLMVATANKGLPLPGYRPDAFPAVARHTFGEVRYKEYRPSWARRLDTIISLIDSNRGLLMNGLALQDMYDKTRFISFHLQDDGGVPSIHMPKAKISTLPLVPGEELQIAQEAATLHAQDFLDMVLTPAPIKAPSYGQTNP